MAPLARPLLKRGHNQVMRDAANGMTDSLKVRRQVGRLHNRDLRICLNEY